MSSFVLYIGLEDMGQSLKKAEALLQVYKEGSEDGMPEPLIFDNSGDSRKDPSYRPSKVNFEEFSKK